MAAKLRCDGTHFFTEVFYFLGDRSLISREAL
jgi:hypothetical protein